MPAMYCHKLAVVAAVVAQVAVAVAAAVDLVAALTAAWAAAHWLAVHPAAARTGASRTGASAQTDVLVPLLEKHRATASRALGQRRRVAWAAERQVAVLTVALGEVHGQY